MANSGQQYRHMICIGDSITSGRKATQVQRCWIHRLGALISDYQDESITVKNMGIGANVLVAQGVASQHSTKPTGLQRLWRDVLSQQPDLVTIAFGTNDLRGGASVSQFISSLETCINAILKSKSADVLVLSTYAIIDYTSAPPWHHACAELFKASNAAVEICCKRLGAIYADVFSVMENAPWTVDQDQIHPNDLGHLLIANRVFEALCLCRPGLSQIAYDRSKQNQFWRDERALRRTDNIYPTIK